MDVNTREIGVRRSQAKKTPRDQQDKEVSFCLERS